jgi:PAS domain S-box-containing protein
VRAHLVAQGRRLRERAQGPHSGALFGALLALVLLLPLWWQGSRWYEAQLLKEQRLETAGEISLLGNALSSVINRRFARLQGLEAFVQTQLQTREAFGTQKVWETFAAALYADTQGIRSFAVAPGGVVRYVYPLAGNEKLIGYEPLQDPDPDVRADVQRAIASRAIILSGPVELVQGGLGLIARQAIYQNGDYWGLVNIVLDVPSLLVEAGFGEQSGALSLALRDNHARIFFGAGSVFQRNPVTNRIELPEGEWELAGVPGIGWTETVQETLRVFQVAGLIIVGLLVSLTYLSINRQARLALAVRQRTQELRESERQYRSIFESTTDGMLINDLAGRLVDFNPAAARMHGYAPEAFRRLQPAQFIHADSLPLFDTYIKTVRQGDEFRGRALDLREDGTPFPIQVLGTGFVYRGQPHALAVVRDITEEVQAYQLLEQRVEERTHELSTLLELSHELASILEFDPLITLILEQLARVVDYTGASVLVLEGGTLQNVGHRGPIPQEMLAQLRFPLEGWEAFKSAMLRREPLIVDDVREETPLAQGYRQAAQAYPDATYSYVRAWMGIPVMVQERLIGVLSITHCQPDVYTLRHATLALAIANQAAIAIENARLYGQARRLAALEERQRLARELHDSVSQALYGIGLGARTARALLDRDPAQAVEPVEYVLSLADAGLAEMRALIFELRPDSLEKEGLVAALTRQAAALRARHDLEVQTAFCEEPALPFEVKEALYRIAQEALNNTVKHAQASRVEIRLDDGEGQITLEARDDGVGFDPQAEYPGHLGLHSMRERAVRLGTTLEIQSEAGRGTLVRVCIPPLSARK